MSNPFDEADVVFRYTRKQAIRDGVLVDCTNTDFKYLLDQLGIKIHVAMTAGAWSATVGGIDEPIPAGQTIEGRLWDVLYALRYAISRGAEIAALRDLVAYDSKTFVALARPKWLRLNR